MCRFAGIDLISDRILDENTILSFRHLLEKHKVGKAIFEAVKTHLSGRSITLRQGTIVDATLIEAPSSTKNNVSQLDPKMHQTKKRSQWDYTLAEGFAYGMKLQAIVDKDSGLIHSVVVTPANVHDLSPAGQLLHGKERVVYTDAGYQGIAKRQRCRARQLLASPGLVERSIGEKP